MPKQFTLPPDTRAVDDVDPAADMNNVVDALNALGAPYSVLNAAYAGGADPAGIADATAAFQAAIAALPAAGGNISVPAGTYKITGTLSFGRNQGMTGAGSALTTLAFSGSGTCVAVFDSSFSSSQSTGGRFSGLNITGSGAGASATGMSYGNLLRARCSDIRIADFTGASATGLKLKNGVSGSTWSEEAEWLGINVNNCTVCVLFDTGSFDYSVFQFQILAGPNQDGVRLQNDASLEGCRLEVRGNFTAGAGNTGAVIAIDRGNASGTSRIDGCQVYVNVECDGATGTGHFTVKADGGSSSRFEGTGVLQFNDETVAFQGASLNSPVQFGFAGRVVDHLLGKMAPGDCLAVHGGSQWAERGSLATALPGTIFLKFADIQAYQLASGSNAVAFSGNLDRARKMDLFLAQPPSGAKGTVTWPGNVIWPGGNVPVLKAANNAVDRFRLIYLPSEGNWYGEIVTAKAAAAAFLPADPAASSSLNTPVMMGLGATCAYTPAGSGLVQVSITALGATAVAAVQFIIGPRFGTGTAPANGAADQGTRFGTAADQLIKVPSIGGKTSVAFTAQIQLVTGTAYWFDLALATNTTGDPASVSNVSMTITELP